MEPLSRMFSGLRSRCTIPVHTYSPGLVIRIINLMLIQNRAVLRIRDVYPGSRIRLFSIPDPGSELSPSRIPYPSQRI
jgi:hypothetical protein